MCHICLINKIAFGLLPTYFFLPNHRNARCFSHSSFWWFFNLLFEQMLTLEVILGFSLTFSTAFLFPVQGGSWVAVFIFYFAVISSLLHSDWDMQECFLMACGKFSVSYVTRSFTRLRNDSMILKCFYSVYKKCFKLFRFLPKISIRVFSVSDLNDKLMLYWNYIDVNYLYLVSAKGNVTW